MAELNITKYMPQLDAERIKEILQDERTQSYTMLILSAFTIAFFGFFAIRPTLTTIAKLNRQITDSRKLNKELSEKINQLVAAQAEYDIIDPFADKIKSAYPQRPEYFTLLTQLTELRNETGASVSGIKIGEVLLTDGAAGTAELSIEAEGGYLSLEELLDAAFSNPRLLTISDLNLRDKSEGRTGTVIGLNSKLSAPYKGGEE